MTYWGRARHFLENDHEVKGFKLLRLLPGTILIALIDLYILQIISMANNTTGDGATALKFTQTMKKMHFL